MIALSHLNSVIKCWLAAGLLLASAGANALTNNQVQMNDVSTLFPLPTDAASHDAFLSASDSGRGGVLLPENLIQKISPPNPPAGCAGCDGNLLKYDDLRVVGFRLDPCFAELDAVAADQAGTCVNQVRLIFQSFGSLVPGNGHAPTEVTTYSANDAAIHALYVVTRQELIDLIEAVVSLRKANQGTIIMAELAPHPVIASQGMTGPFASGLKELLQTYVGQQNLVRLTRFTQNTGVGPKWTFDGFDVHGDDLVNLSIVSNLSTIPAGTSSQIFFGGFGPVTMMHGSFTPAMADGLALLSDVGSTSAASAGARQSAYNVTLKVENPHFATANSVDCASCHVAGAFRRNTELTYPLSPMGNVNAFQPDPAITAAEMRQTTSFDAGFVNLHAFSYFDFTPGINFRVINETAAVVAFVNRRLLGNP